MADYIEPIERLSLMYRKLGGIGKKTAVRLAFETLDLTEQEAAEFADAILAVKRDILLCSCCQNISTSELCPVCASETREKRIICVVEDPRAVSAIENVREYKGTYHVLHGAISPMKGIGPEKLKIKELLHRLHEEDVEEVILATNPTVEGEATAMYLSKLIAPLGIKVSRIANGVPVGGDLEYTDAVTLTRALRGRYSLET